MRPATAYPIGQALLVAVLFSASAPIARLLLGEVAPISLAALLYLAVQASTAPQRRQIMDLVQVHFR